jgi:hypothetical protein
MANEIYDSTWWGNTRQTASSIGTSTEMIQGQFNLTKLGDEEVTNGDFATDSDWNKSSFWTISNGVALMSETSSYLPLFQNDVTVPNVKYKLTFDIISITGSIKATSLNNGATAGEITLGVYSTVGTKEVFFTTQTQCRAVSFARVVGISSSCSIDNVSVKEARATTVEASKCLADTIHRIGLQDIQN